MKRTPTVLVLASLAVLQSQLLAAGKPATPKRSFADIQADLVKSDAELERKHFPGDVVNPRYRKSLTDEAVPVLTKRLELVKEISETSPANKAKYRWRLARTLAELSFYQVADATQALETAAASANVAEATPAKIAMQAKAWWEAAGKPEEQAKVLAEVETIAADQPKDEAVALGIKNMIDNNPSTTALTAKAWDVLATLKSPAATQLNAMPNKVGKPLVISGPLVNGKQFNSKQWAGKVILIDFWATWCPPCMEEVPRVAKLYKDYHDKGLEIVGVSSDQDKRDLTSFLKNHPEMPWPQMFVGGSSWHPLTKKFEINGIPCMYLIDRQGILRTTNARSEAEKLLPELLGGEAANDQPATPQEEAAMKEAKKMLGVK